MPLPLPPPHTSVLSTLIILVTFGHVRIRTRALHTRKMRLPNRVSEARVRRVRSHACLSLSECVRACTPPFPMSTLHRHASRGHSRWNGHRVPRTRSRVCVCVSRLCWERRHTLVYSVLHAFFLSVRSLTFLGGRPFLVSPHPTPTPYHVAGVRVCVRAPSFSLTR